MWKTILFEAAGSWNQLGLPTMNDVWQLIVKDLCDGSGCGEKYYTMFWSEGVACRTCENIMYPMSLPVHLLLVLMLNRALSCVLCSNFVVLVTSVEQFRTC